MQNNKYIQTEKKTEFLEKLEVVVMNYSRNFVKRYVCRVYIE